MTLLKKRKILQILPVLSAGGVEQGTLDIVSALVAEGAEAYVAASHGLRLEELKSYGGRFVSMPLASKNLFKVTLQNVWLLAHFIRKHKIDLVHARSRAPAWSAFWACRLTRTPFVTTFHGTYNFKSMIKRFYNSSMVRGDRVIAISDFIQGHLLTHYKKWVSKDKVTRIYRGIDLQEYDKKSVAPERCSALRLYWKVRPDEKIFLMPGRLTRWKGQETALKALAKVSDPNLRLVIVGSDQGRYAYRQELQALSQELNLGQRVRIVEHCDDMPAAYALASCVIHASTDPEAFGRVVAEGQAMGLPCLISDLGAPQEIIKNGQTGWLVPAGNCEKLAKAMQAVLGLSDLQKEELSQKARQRVEENFSLQKMCQKTLALYSDLLKEKDPVNE